MEDHDKCPCTDIKLLEQKVDSLVSKIGKIEADVSGLVEAWRTAGTLVKFVKWLSGIGSAVYVMYEIFKTKI